MAADDALSVLVDPENLVKNTVTIPEGLRVTDIVDMLAEKTDFAGRPSRRCWTTPTRSGCRLRRRATRRATCSRRPTTSARRRSPRTCSQMVARWQQSAEDADLEGGAAELGYTPAEMMTIASLIESEARRDEDYPRSRG